ncbi:MAG: LapA family protein [Planctomycetes bacterium]|nr:LapA family protein [Planctomycetota bacterium]
MKRVKVAGGVLLGFLLLVLILQNTDPVQTRIFSASFSMPLALTLIACVGAGFGLGWLCCWARLRRRAANASGDARQVPGQAAPGHR